MHFRPHGERRSLRIHVNRRKPQSSHTALNVSLLLLIVASIGVFFPTRELAQRANNRYTRSNQESGNYLQQLLQTLEPNNPLRFALQQGRRGDGIHYWWMDTMRTFGIKQATFEMDFEYRTSGTSVKITDAHYLTQYYRYGTATTDASTLERIRSTGLAQGLESEILKRARIFLKGQSKSWTGEQCGMLYLNLLDHELLPVLDEPFYVDSCKSSPEPGAKRASHVVISQETYRRVLDIVFPPTESYKYILRFEPSFAPESQIIINTQGAKTEVVELTSLSGNIYAKLDRLKADGASEDAIAMARLIQVRKRTIEVPPHVASRWFSTFSDSQVASLKLLEERQEEEARGTGTMVIDGTLYSIWNHTSRDAFFREWDYEINDQEVSGEFQLVKWMNSVRRDISGLAATTSAKK